MRSGFRSGQGVVLRVITDYAYALGLLDDFDHHRIRLGQVRKGKDVTMSN